MAPHTAHFRVKIRTHTRHISDFGGNWQNRRCLLTPDLRFFKSNTERDERISANSQTQHWSTAIFWLAVTSSHALFLRRIEESSQPFIILISTNFRELLHGREILKNPYFLIIILNQAFLLSICWRHIRCRAKWRTSLQLKQQLESSCVLNFTYETSVNVKMPFLDVNIKSDNGQFVSDVYRKSTNDGKLLNAIKVNAL